MYTSEYASINPNSIQTSGIQTWSFLGDLNNNGKADRNELGTLKSQFVAKSNAIDPNLKDPKNDEIMFAFQRELATNWSLNVDWIQRWFRDATTDQNCYGLPCNTVASTAYAPTRVVTDSGPGQHPRHRRRPLADLLRRAAGSTSARTRSSTPTAATTSTFDCTQRYKALEFSIGKRMSNRWQMQGSYVWSRLDGAQPGINTNSTAARNVSTSPTRTTRSTSSARAAAPTTSRTPSSCSAATRRRWGINVGANFQALSGLPIDRTLTVALCAGLARHSGRTARHLPRELPQPAVAARRQGRSASAATRAHRSSPSCTTCSTRAPARAATER